MRRFGCNSKASDRATERLNVRQSEGSTKRRTTQRPSELNVHTSDRSTNASGRPIECQSDRTTAKPDLTAAGRPLAGAHTLPRPDQTRHGDVVSIQSVVVVVDVAAAAVVVVLLLSFCTFCVSPVHCIFCCISVAVAATIEK